MAAAAGLAALPAPQSAAAADAVLRGELVDRDGRPTLAAVRRMRWGTQVLSERPLLLIEGDPRSYFQASDADQRLAEIAAALGDEWRLAAYVAFKQLHERKQKDFLALWRPGIEAADPLAARLIDENRRGVACFVDDHPEFAKLVYWTHFVLVASVLGRFGVQNADGTRAVYALCSHLRHSCRPNVAAFALRRGFPRGRRMVHVIAAEGVARGEELVLSELPEALLCRPRPERWERLRLRGGSPGGAICSCRRCSAEAHETQDACIGRTLDKLQRLLDVIPPTDESTKEAFACFQELDKALPFSMLIKAKTKVLLASSFSELNARAAWQEDNRGANIIQWTGLSVEALEQRLKDTKKLYESAAKDFEYLLGQDALPILQRLEAGYAPIRDQHKVLSKYAREREQPPTAVFEPPGRSGEAALRACGEEAPAEPAREGKESLPPGWGEIFRSTLGA